MDGFISRMHCITCRRRLAHERSRDGTDPQVCVECRKETLHKYNLKPGIPLAEEQDQ